MIMLNSVCPVWDSIALQYDQGGKGFLFHLVIDRYVSFHPYKMVDSIHLIVMRMGMDAY